ncbi:hypothetical protein JK207_07375 [Gluconobacter cerinus]|uniref:hypothetical protein n=1 Tax=Gluconobacter TaxID=441 RepID=UPI001B8AC953|nr:MULTISPECIES: hypothetical protein [Gluconobacter]MBS0994608.1 hypothetical protein [Gluconobacter cerinus]MBS1021854.1 hypothetical protein [Gluconobacter cerinus]
MKYRFGRCEQRLSGGTYREISLAVVRSPLGQKGGSVRGFTSKIYARFDNQGCRLSYTSIKVQASYYKATDALMKLSVPKPKASARPGL